MTPHETTGDAKYSDVRRGKIQREALRTRLTVEHGQISHEARGIHTLPPANVIPSRPVASSLPPPFPLISRFGIRDSSVFLFIT